MANIQKGFTKITRGILNALLPDDETARKIGERYLTMYVGIDKRER